MGTGSGNLDATLNPAVNAANPTIDLVMEAVNSFHDILLSMNLMKSGTVLININVVFTMTFVLKNFITTFLAATPVTCFSQITAANLYGIRSKAKLDDIVERSLKSAAIWDELKDRLKKSALGLSGGQQQRLCIARALAVEPEVLLMDEPTSALDPISTSRIEDLAAELKKSYTIVIVTHNMQQAARISDKTAFFLLGEIIEYADTESLFSVPKDKRTEDYITGRFG